MTNASACDAVAPAWLVKACRPSCLGQPVLTNTPACQQACSTARLQASGLVVCTSRQVAQDHKRVNPVTIFQPQGLTRGFGTLHKLAADAPMIRCCQNSSSCVNTQCLSQLNCTLASHGTPCTNTNLRSCGPTSCICNAVIVVASPSQHWLAWSPHFRVTIVEHHERHPQPMGTQTPDPITTAASIAW